MRKNNVLNTYQCWFQSVHFISFTVNQNDMRRFQFPNKTRSLSVIRVGRKWNIRNLKYKVIRYNHQHRWAKILVPAVYFLSGCTFILKNRSSNLFNRNMKKGRLRKFFVLATLFPITYFSMFYFQKLVFLSNLRFLDFVDIWYK